MLAEQKQQNLLLKFLMNKKWSFIRHLILLIPLVSIFVPNVSEMAKLIPDYKLIMSAVYKHGIFMFCLSVFIIYFNLFVLMPKLLLRNRYLLYALSFLGLSFIYYLGEYFHGNYVYKGLEKHIDLPNFNLKDIIDNTLLPSIFLGATVGYKIFKKWVIDAERINELKNNQLKEELNQLKNQVNPHFLFNTLNNLETLIKTDTEKASQVVHGLSDVLRYQIYDSNKELILLSKDIEIMSEFLLLEKIRRDKFSYEIVIESSIDGILVPPLLFVNFIDNALKHSIDNRNTSYLKVKFNVLNNQLFFLAENSKPSFIHQKEKGGFGLKNIQRRLELLYANKYELSLFDEPNKYIVNLKITL